MRLDKFLDECGKDHSEKKKRMVEANDEAIINSMAKKLIGKMKSIAKEPVEVEYTKGSFYVFGSELATLRIFMKYSNKGKHNPNDKFDVGYSSNLKKFYFRMEV
jgi:hypothetical protein